MRVLLVSDFFHPSVGGVETHMYNLAQNLMASGHKVVVLTCARGKRCGVRYLRNGLKVYHIPRLPLSGGNTLPTIYGTLRLFRVVALRERIDLVHAHQTSTLSLECLIHARTMNLRTVYTCHSLHGFADIPSILLNKVLKISLINVDAVICVSNVSKENMVLRASIPPAKTFVIPNAVHTSVFSPRGKLSALSRSAGAGHEKAIVVVSRLVYRKGIDLLAQVMGEVCLRDPRVTFTIVGDGPKRALLDSVVRERGLHDRVRLLGNLPHEDVIHVLEKGNVFLNLSLTEAFGMAMLEAASVGLLVVSTCVGGVPEIFPRLARQSNKDEIGMILCAPKASSVLSAIDQALSFLPRTPKQVRKQHNLVKVAYNWENVASRTEKVYRFCAEEVPVDSVYERLCKSMKCGRFMGPIYCCVIAIHILYYKFLNLVQPHIELAWDLNPQCREQILALQQCHKEHSLSKFWGACNDVKIKLDACFRKQKEYKSKVNLTKARAERERLEERRRRASGGE